MGRSAVLLVSGNHAIGLKVLVCLRFGGYDVDVLSLKGPGQTRYSRYRRHFDVLSSHVQPGGVPQEIVDFVRAKSARRGWCAVIADDLDSHGFLHEAAGRLPIPAFAPVALAVLEHAHDKWSFYNAVNGSAVTVPSSCIVRAGREVTRQQAEDVGWPLLVKPLNAESGHGIVRFNDLDALRDYLATPGPYKSFPLKLQRFIAGHELGVSFLAERGEILTCDVQLDCDEHGARRFYDDPEAVAVASQIVKCFDFGGPGHIDFIRETATGRLFALEFNPRYWYSVSVSLWRGGNFPAMAVDLALGRSVPANPTRPGRYLQPKTLLGCWRNPRRLAVVDWCNVKGFLSVLSDPLPYLMQRASLRAPLEYAR